MFLPASIPQAILDTILGRLALLFLAGAGADLAVARDAAAQMLAAYHPETPAQLSLAAEIISFSFNALEALSQAANPDLSPNRTLRLRGSAVSLSRESHKSQRKLDQLQRASRVAGQPRRAEIQPATTAPNPGVDTVLVDAGPLKPQHGGQSWSGALQKRMTAKRMAENMKKKQAQHASQAAHLIAVVATPQTAVRSA
jgi:hypothetical protein